MSSTSFFPIALKNTNDRNHKIELCNDVMNCACCSYYLEIIKQTKVDIIIESLEKQPKKITSIKIPLYPIPESLGYFNFDGISTIVYNLLKTSNPKHKSSMEKHEGFLKVYFEENPLFNIPIINIELILFGQLKSKSIDILHNKLRDEIIQFTGSIGKIDIVEIKGVKHLNELLKIPLLLGYPEFKREGVFEEYDFSEEQLTELNYIHAMQLLPLNMNSVINDRTLELFSSQKACIIDDKQKASKYISSDESDLDYCKLCPDDEYNSEELPF